MTMSLQRSVVAIPMLWTCSIVLGAHGRLRSSVGRALLLLPHLLGTWPSSRGAKEVIAVLRCSLRGCCLG
jgi:hypothetical protein